MDERFELSKGFAFVEYHSHKDAQRALVCMDEGQIDGNFIRVSYVIKESDGSSRNFCRSPSPLRKHNFDNRDRIRRDGDRYAKRGRGESERDNYNRNSTSLRRNTGERGGGHRPRSRSPVVRKNRSHQQSFREQYQYRSSSPRNRNYRRISSSRSVSPVGRRRVSSHSSSRSSSPYHSPESDHGVDRSRSPSR